MSTLSTVDLNLEQLETTIQNGLVAFQQGLQGFCEAGEALGQIKKLKLHKKTHRTFTAYCEERWGLSETRAYELISASVVQQQLSAFAEFSAPVTEAQCRPLTRLPEVDRPVAWQAATEISNGKAPTSKQVKKAAAAVKQKDNASTFQPGQVLTVEDKESEYFGQTVEVVNVNGVIVNARTDRGNISLLTTELSPPQQPEPKRVWTAQSNKADRLEALEAEHQIAELRIGVLEEMLLKVITAARAQRLTHSLLAEAERLLN